MPTSSLAPAPDRPRAGADSAKSAAARDLAACRGLLANGSRTFLAASYLLPRAVREPACALYAFCRIADDAIDGAPAGQVSVALGGLRRRLDAVYCGEAVFDAVDRAFAAVVRRHAIPRALPEALLEGFAWDAAGRRYATLAELHDYAARVAGAVGAMMALVMGVRSPVALARACDLGVAMQLSNIARDVGEDARAGRLYLPCDWLHEAGIDTDVWLAAPRFDERLAGVVARLLAEAEALYTRAAAGVAELPAGCRLGIEAARSLYAEIGREVGRRGHDSVAARAVVGRRRKLVVLGRATGALWRTGACTEPPLPATRHLVEAAASMRVAAAASGTGAPGRVVWLIDLFERLERQDRLQRTASAR